MVLGVEGGGQLLGELGDDLIVHLTPVDTSDSILVGGDGSDVYCALGGGYRYDDDDHWQGFDWIAGAAPQPENELWHNSGIEGSFDVNDCWGAANWIYDVVLAALQS